MPMISRYFQAIPYDEGSAIIWHSIFGRPMLATKTQADFLQAHTSRSFGYEELFGDGYEKDKAAVDAIVALSKARIMLTEWEVLTGKEGRYICDLHREYDLSSGNKIKYLSLIMSEECNFRCKYCIHFANAEHQHNPTKMMSLDVAQRSIDSYLDMMDACGREQAYINFGGGEPLLNWRTIESLLPYIRERSQKWGIPVKMGINTNMSLMTEDIAKTLIEYGVEIAASLDGTQAGNDAVRLTKSLEGTHAQIMHGFGIMRNLGHPLDGFAMTVTEDNFYDVDTHLVDWAASLGMIEIRIDIDVVGAVNLPIDEIVAKLMKVRRYARTKGISVIGFWSRPAENMGRIPEEEDIGFCGAERGNSICVAPSGQVFPCGYSNYELGNYKEILNIFWKEPMQDLREHRRISHLVSHGCSSSCPILGFCRGGCMITREAAGGNTDKVSRMCELYRKMTYGILRESVAE